MGRKIAVLFDLLSVVTSGLLLAAALLCRHASDISPETGRFWALLALSMPGVLLLNLAALLYWLLRRRWLVCLLPLAALLSNGEYVAAMVQLHPAADARTRSDLRVASLNAYYFGQGKSRYQMVRTVAGIMSREQVDMLCLQEVPTLPIDSIFRYFAARMPYFVQESSEMILSRYPILDHRYARFADSWNAYLLVDLAVGEDTVRVVSVHLQTTGVAALRARYRKEHDREAPVEALLGEVERNSRLRARQVHELERLIDSVRGPLILAGDFNDPPLFVHLPPHRQPSAGRVPGRRPRLRQHVPFPGRGAAHRLHLLQRLPAVRRLPHAARHGQRPSGGHCRFPVRALTRLPVRQNPAPKFADSDIIPIFALQRSPRHTRPGGPMSG